jgi:phosphoribosylaminoimidazolecarboxamide formyltransferase/IMP cyclohydrolase
MTTSNVSNVFNENIKIKRALISVTDKSNIDILAQKLVNFNIEILSTGGTAKFLKDKSIPVTDVDQKTNFPEILDGRVKTLHPKIHGGILNRRNNPTHVSEINKHEIEDIDLVIINLYKFKETLSKTSDSVKIIENIDIGGPAMIRAAAKNHEFVTVITDPKDYDVLIKQLDNQWYNFI